MVILAKKTTYKKKILIENLTEMSKIHREGPIKDIDNFEVLNYCY